MSYVRTLKRIRTHKTNYRKRQALLVSRQNFVTVKITNQNAMAQIIKPELGGDVVKVSVHSRELRQHGWKGSLNSLPACFLLGVLLGKKARQNGIDKAILYIGNKAFTSRIAACMKGILESGLDLPVSEDSIPSRDRLTGLHIAEYATRMKKEDIRKYNQVFSSVIRQGLMPENYQSHAEDIASQIMQGNLSAQSDNLHSRNRSSSGGNSPE
ncbi:MAG: 50S ribosomal protein L18 [Thermoproteota archaeon]|nr:50S ribosomal protein L18 [Thermoproteota archaeon]